MSEPERSMHRETADLNYHDLQSIQEHYVDEYRYQDQAEYNGLEQRNSDRPLRGHEAERLKARCPHCRGGRERLGFTLGDGGYNQGIFE
jgi:hypothetical protein